MCWYLFFVGLKQQAISFLLDYSKLIGIWFVKGLLRKQCLAPFTNYGRISSFSKAEKIVILRFWNIVAGIGKWYNVNTEKHINWRLYLTINKLKGLNLMSKPKKVIWVILGIIIFVFSVFLGLGYLGQITGGNSLIQRTEMNDKMFRKK